MPLVSDILDSLDSAVRETGQTYFENTAEALWPVATTFTALMVVLVGLNMSLGVYHLKARDSWQIITRLVLVYSFGFSWSNFGVIYDALTDGTGNLAMSFFIVGGAEAPSPEAAMDDFSVQMSDAVDGAARSVGSIMRGVIGALLYIILAILMAAYVLIVGFAKIMIAFLLGVAPIAMFMTIFDRTKNLFEAWLSSFVGYLMYPIAAAAIIGAVVNVAGNQFHEQAEVENLSMLLGFFVVVFVAIFALKSIPAAASNITGQFNLASFAPQAISLMGSPGAAAGRAAGSRAREFVSGAMTGKSGRAADAAKSRDWAERGAHFSQKMRGINIMRSS